MFEIEKVEGGLGREPGPDSGVPSWLLDPDDDGVALALPTAGAGTAVLESDGLIDEWDLLDHQIAGLVEPNTLRAEDLAETVPGADLAHLLERGRPADADDYALVESVAAWRRIAAWAAAGAAAAAAELADRPSMNPNWPESAGKVSELNVAGEELAMRLSCSRMEARHLVRDGRSFRGPLTPTGDALARGDIDLPRARVLVRALEEVSVPLALDVQDEVLPGAAGRTAPQLGRDVARALITADPAGAHARHRAALRGRRLDRPKVLPDGMAGLWAVLPAADAVRLDAGINTLAYTARSAGDERTLDQLRADLLVDLTLGRFTLADECVGVKGVGGPDDVRDPGGVGDPDRVGDRGVCDTNGGRDPDGSRATAEGRATAGGRDHRGRDSGGPVHGTSGSAGRVRPPRRVTARSQIRVTVPMTSLQGMGDEPGELAGYGPITAETAQDLANDGVWTRLVTDPVTGAVLDVGRAHYRPPTVLAEHVRARDRYCARPGCSVRAEACDLDHTIEYGREHGETRDANLGPLCARDHQIKTDGGFPLSQVAPGVFEWVTPTGHCYRVTPGADLPVEHLPRGQSPPPF